MRPEWTSSCRWLSPHHFGAEAPEHTVCRPLSGVCAFTQRWLCILSGAPKLPPCILGLHLPAHPPTSTSVLRPALHVPGLASGIFSSQGQWVTGVGDVFLYLTARWAQCGRDTLGRAAGALSGLAQEPYRRPSCSSKGFSGGAYIRLQNKSGPWGMSRHARAVLYVVSAVT